MLFRMVYKSGQIFLPFCHNTRVWQTDRILIARPSLHSMQRRKNSMAGTERQRKLLLHRHNEKNKNKQKNSTQTQNW